MDARRRLNINRLNQSGQSLIQVVIMVGVMGVVMMGFVSMQSAQQKMTMGTQTAISRNALQLQLQQTLVSAGAMARTMAYADDPGNLALKECLHPSGNSCVQTNSPQGFFLIDATGSKIAGAGSKAPVLYDYTGTPCQTANSQCLFQVYTQYTATCPNNASPCSSPSVTATYTISQDPKVTPPGGVALKTVTGPSILLSAVGALSLEQLQQVCAAFGGAWDSAKSQCGGIGGSGDSSCPEPRPKNVCSGSCGGGPYRSYTFVCSKGTWVQTLAGIGDWPGYPCSDSPPAGSMACGTGL